MKRTWLPLLTALLLPLAAAAVRWDRAAEYKLQEKDEIRRSLPFADPSRPMTLSVDDVWGGIDVQAADVSAVELVARRTIRAKSAETIARAKDEVSLKIEPRGNAIDLYVDGPFRCQVGDCRGIRRRDPGYEVAYDFVLQVPRLTRLTLKTVMGGDIAVRGVEGDFDVSNVNGGVSLSGLAGAGRAETVNGGVSAGFRRAPAGACAFKTINGQVELSFPDGLGADLRLKTMNGEAFSDFETTRLPSEAPRRESRDGKYVYAHGGFTGLRIGRGGPEIRCETLNGDILVSKNK